MADPAASDLDDPVASRDVVDAAFESLARAPPAAANRNARNKFNPLEGDTFVFMGVSLEDELDVVRRQQIDKGFGTRFIELRRNGKILGKCAAAPPFDIGRNNRNVNTADDRDMTWNGLKIGSEPGHLARIETGVDGVFTLALDDGIAVERNEVDAAKVKGVIRRAEASVKELAGIGIIQGDIVIAGTGMKRHLELLNTIKVSLARIGVEAHIPHVPYKRRLEGVDLGDGLAEFGDSDFASLDVNVSNKGDVEVASIPRIEPSDNRSATGGGKVR